MMITARSSSIRFSSSSVAMPSSPGIMMSTSAASNGSARAISSPSAPDEATRTSYPSRVSRVSRISRMISSSSTTRIVPWREVAIPLLRPCAARGHREPAPARHRVACVQEQVQEYLLQLVLDAADDHGLAREIAANLDAADLELMLEQCEDVADHRIQIDLYPIIGRRSRTGE